MNAQTAEGGCLCGAIRYRISGAPAALTRCHCRTCRLAAGAPAVAWAIFDADAFEWIAGEPAAFESSPGITRTFCGRCGTSLAYRSASRPRVVDVTAATLDDANRFAPLREIWIEEKLAWEPLDDALPHYPRSSTTSEPTNR